MNARWTIRASAAGFWCWSAATAAAATGPGARVWLPEPITTTAPLIDQLFTLILIITGIAFVLVEGTLLAFLVRYRHRPGRAATYTHGNVLVEIVWTAIPALILVWLAIYSQHIWAKVRGAPPPEDLRIGITAEQFVWNIRYPGADGALNTADDITTINQLHLPVGKTILIQLTSKDVIHSFFVPQFRMKQDAVPGLTGRVWVSVTKPGHYDIACAELCGLGHFRMRGFLTAETPEAFQGWLTQKAPPAPVGVASTPVTPPATPPAPAAVH